MPEMVAAVAVVIDRLPDWLWPMSIRTSVRFHVTGSYRLWESLRSANGQRHIGRSL